MTPLPADPLPPNMQSPENEPCGVEPSPPPDAPAPVLDGISGEEIEAMVRAQGEAAGPGAPAAGRVRTGRITEVLGEDVFVAFEDGSRGTVPVTDFGQADPPVVGAEVHVIVERYDPLGGFMVLSKRKADRLLAWDRLRPGAIVEGRIVAMNKGGLEVDLGGIRAFMPASQCDIHRMRDISTLLSQTVRCEIMQVNRSKEDVVVSRRNALIRDREEARKRKLDEIQEGQVRRGTVGNLTEYGAFVDLGGVDGLLHISDMSWARVRQASDCVRPGQQIDVMVLKVDRVKGKVSLGLKQTKPNPWETADVKYPVGTRVRGRVTRLAEFGAFVEIEEGLEGLVPLTEMSWARHVRKPSDVVNEGAEVEAIVIALDKERQRLSLGMKQVEPDPWAGIAERFPKDVTVPGKVTRVMDYGAFVEIQPGIEGLVHISEMSEQRVRTPRDLVEEGKEVSVRVIGIDQENRRISLSLRPAPVHPAAQSTGRAPKKPETRKRKKPLRGGLTSHFEWM